MTRSLTIPLSPGSEPEIEDCTQAVGEREEFETLFNIQEIKQAAQ